jgi:hypothetical protein
LHVVLIEPAGTQSEWGEIAARGLLETSGQGPYAATAQQGAALLRTTADPQLSSPAASVARVIVRAVTARRPRPRYPAGRGAGLIVTMRKFFSDRLMDAVMRATIRFAARRNQR